MLVKLKTKQKNRESIQTKAIDFSRRNRRRRRGVNDEKTTEARLSAAISIRRVYILVVLVFLCFTGVPFLAAGRTRASHQRETEWP